MHRARQRLRTAMALAGETCGATEDDGSQPDLLAAVSTGGVEGYLRVSELEAA